MICNNCKWNLNKSESGLPKEFNIIFDSFKTVNCELKLKPIDKKCLMFLERK